ncbi:MAG: acetate--CoA ligase family protein [Parcubacteria group bacterium]|jgi:acetyltransferase
MRNLNTFFNPSSIAIVGASSHKGKMGSVFLKNIRSGGWKGKIYPVNPSHKKIGSLRCYSTLSEIGKKVDLVIIAVPAQFVRSIIMDGAESNPKMENFIVISAGFKETGKEGGKRENEIVELSEKLKLNVLGPNCLGFINPEKKLNASFTQPFFDAKSKGKNSFSGKFRPGKVAIISQSGALGVALLDWTENMSLGFSKVISIGNKSVLNEADILDYLTNDKSTKAVALYLEDIKNGPEFIDSMNRIIKKKPVFILKAGKNSAGQKAISSHTGSLAQDDAIISAIFRKIGAIEANDIAELQDLILYCSSDSIPQKNEIIVITNAGGPGVLSADYIGRSKKIRLYNFSKSFKTNLKKDLPESASVENPVDVIGDAPPERFEKILKKISANCPSCPVLIILTPQSQTNPEKVADIVCSFKNKFPVLTTCFMGGAKIKKAMEKLHQNGVANFETPERALMAIEKLIFYSNSKNKNFFAMPGKAINLKLKTNSILNSALQQKRKMLFWDEAEKMFRAYGINLASSRQVNDKMNTASIKLPFPWALKTDEPSIAHRLDKNAVILNLKSKNEFRNSLKRMKKSTGASHFLVQSMAKPGLEIILGLKRDPFFGPIIVCGLGGSFTELFRDRVILAPPLTPAEIKEDLKGLKIYPMLKGYRGGKGYNLDEISILIVALQRIASENPNVYEIDINPVMIYNNGQKCQILDAKVYVNK